MRKNENIKARKIDYSPEVPVARAETIAALSTPPGIGAVAVVRISGTGAWETGRLIVKEKKLFERLEPRQNALFTIISPESGEPLDSALVVKYRGPASFTGEDVLEVQCHGGAAAPEAVCRAAFAAGARAARAGEFTRRAFLNGKLDLAQAEAVDGLIQARTESGRQLAFSGLHGELSLEIERLRELLLELKAELEYQIDFPDEEPLAELDRKVRESCRQAAESMRRLLDGAERDLLLGRGALTVIAGAPNVGKSSLFNSLLGTERSIVTSRPGTTRDAVEMETLIEGVLFRLVDTAGLRKGKGEAEKMGVEYSRRFIAGADVVLFVHEAGSDFVSAEREFLQEFAGRRIVRVVNKIDLLHNGDQGIPEGYIGVSALESSGIGELREALVRAVMPGGEPDSRPPAGGRVTSRRQKYLLEEALRVLEGLDHRLSAEFLAAELAEAGDRLGEITGRITSEDVLERIFSNFCIGK